MSLFAIVLTVQSVVHAQQLPKVPRIGFLSLTSASTLGTRLAAFRQGLHELGYEEGKNIAIEYRWAEDKEELLHDLAADLARLKVDVIVSAGPPPTRAARAATATIPIVMAQDNDPVGNGFIANFARPGGNITGLSNHDINLNGKRLELLKEAVPMLSRVALLGTSTLAGFAQLLKHTEQTANQLKLTLQYLDAHDSKDIETAFLTAKNWRADAVLVLGMSHVFDSQRALTVELAAKKRLPAMYPQIVFMDAGGLMFYGTSGDDLFRRAAIYVDKILKGKKPANLPVERARAAEFIVNLKAARQIGLMIPPMVLQQTDRIIE